MLEMIRRYLCGGRMGRVSGQFQLPALKAAISRYKSFTFAEFFCLCVYGLQLLLLIALV